MALPSPNTDPRKGRPTTETSGKGAAEANEAAEGLNDIEDAIVQQLNLIAKFAEVIKNYVPKLGFIDAHTAAIKLSTDKIKKDIATLVKASQEDDNDAGPVDDTGGGGNDAEPVDSDGDDPYATEATLVEVKEAVERIATKLEEGDEDPRDDSGDDDSGGGAKGGDKDDKDAEAPKKKSKGAFAAITNFLQMIKKFFLVALLLVAPLLTASSDLFNSLKSLFDKLFEAFQLIVGVFVSEILPHLASVMGLIADTAIQLLDMIMPIIEEMAPIIGEVMSTIMTVLAQAVEAIMPMVQTILDILVPIIKFVMGLLQFLFESVLGPIITAIAPVIEFVGDMFRGLFNAIIGMINGVLEAVASVVGIFSKSKAEKIRAMKMEKIEKDESKEAAESIDFAQDDETIDAQIDAKLESGEINKKTAESLKKNKDKHRKEQEKKREEARKQAVEKFQVQEEVAPAALENERMDLISFTIPEEDKFGSLAGKKILVDRGGGRDEDGNYGLYNEEGAPLEMKGPAATAIQMGAHMAVTSLQKEEESSGGMDLSNIGAAFGQAEGSDVAAESLDVADAQSEAAAGGSTQNNTNANVNTQQNVNQQTQNFSSGGSDPNGGRGPTFGQVSGF